MSLPVGASIEMEGRKLLDKHMTIIAIYNMLPGLPQRQQTADWYERTGEIDELKLNVLLLEVSMQRKVRRCEAECIKTTQR